MEGPKNPSEKIMWLVDMMLSNTEPTRIEERIQA